jgi:GNAT superfamily N-acetyltransferase
MALFKIRLATVHDVPLILQFIRDLAEYERMADQVVATEEQLRGTLFGEKVYAEVLIGEENSVPVAFALFFHNYSTFLSLPGLYLEDLFVKPEFRGRGYGKALLARLANIARQRGCGRFEWWVLDWNQSAIDFYRKLGAEPMSDWTVFRVTGGALDQLADLDQGHSQP